MEDTHSPSPNLIFQQVLSIMKTYHKESNEGCDLDTILGMRAFYEINTILENAGLIPKKYGEYE